MFPVSLDLQRLVPVRKTLSKTYNDTKDVSDAWILEGHSQSNQVTIGDLQIHLPSVFTEASTLHPDHEINASSR
jgi:hypothetical protein